MTELEWCRDKLPETLISLPDVEALKFMHNVYVAYQDFKENLVLPDDTLYDLTDHQQRLAYAVITLANELESNMALKGGYLLSHILSDAGRVSKDIDIDIPSISQYERLQGLLHVLGEHFIEIGIADYYAVDFPDNEELCGGLTVKMGKRTVLKCDIGWRRLGYGTVVKNLEIGSVNTFCIERILSDKIAAMLGPQVLRRAKDMYDIFAIAQTYSFDAARVHVFMKMDFPEAESLFSNYPLNPDILSKLEHAYTKLRLTSLSGRVIDKAPFDDVCDLFGCIVEKVINPSKPRVWSMVNRRFV